jgi:hypothetical protein
MLTKRVVRAYHKARVPYISTRYRYISQSPASYALAYAKRATVPGVIRLK